MSTLFVLLFLTSLGLLTWGLIAPKSLAKRASIATKTELTRKHFALFFGLASFMLLILASATAPSNAQQGVQTSNQPKSAQTQSKVEKKTVTETKSVAYGTKTVDDASLNKGTTKVTTQGVNGIETLTYLVTYTNGKQTAKDLQSDKVTTQPVDQVTSVGTYVAPAPSSSCNPNYTGYCVPNVSYDLNCSDISHRVYVVGTDVYRFDADHDGVGCESY
jgi:hypothetical protein